MARFRELAPGVWEVTVSAGRDSVTGRYRQRSARVRTGANRPHAGKNPPRVVQEKAAELARAAKATTQLSTTDITLGRLFDAYIDHQTRRGRAPKTLLEYRRIADRLGEINMGNGLFGDIPLPKLTSYHIDRMQIVLQDRGLGETSRHHYHAFLSQALNQAVKWRFVDRNEASSAHAPTLRAEERTPPTAAELNVLFDTFAATEPDLAALVVVAAITGCRRGELSGLRWRDVNIADGYITVRRAISDLPNRLGGPVEKDTKTHRVRTVALDVRSAAELLGVQERARASCAAVETDLTTDCFVWSQEPERTIPWRPGRITNTFRATRRLVGLDHVQLKDLRHWAATHLVAEGVDIKTIAGRLGHSEQVLLRIYAHRLPAQDRAGAKILGELLGRS